MTALVLLLAFQNQDRDIEQLRREVEESKQKQRELEQRLQVLERLQEKEREKEFETMFDEGFWFVTKDDRLRLGSSAQFDGRFFPQGEDGDSNFLVRRARIFATGILEDKFGYMVMGRWDQQVPNLHFAWLEAQHVPWLRLRVGLFKEPFSLEGLHSDQHWDFTERSLGVANFLQLEDIGAMLYGKFWEDRIEYGAGVFNGRGRSLDNNPDKEWAARVVVAPLRKQAEIFNDLYLGGSFSRSQQTENLSGTGFNTGAGTRLWTWNSAPATTVDDDKVRWGADLEWLRGPFALRAEVVHVDFGDVVRGAASDAFSGRGWYVEGAWVFTGENKRRNRPVFPEQNFDPAKGTWGAWEVVARWEDFRLDEGSLSAGLATGTDRARGFTIGVNGYLNRHMGVKLDAQRLKFDDTVIVGTHENDDEWALFLRFQFEI